MQSELPGITPGAVRKRLERGRLLAVPFGEGTNYPVWQFDENGVVEHFSNIIAMINTSSPVGMLRFFLTYDEDLDKTPIDALRGGDPKALEMVEILAQQFRLCGTQGACHARVRTPHSLSPWRVL